MVQQLSPEVESAAERLSKICRASTSHGLPQEISKVMSGRMIRLYEDGSQWCALIGEDIQSGICGFAADPINALLSLSEQMRDREVKR